jgi:hypothetical protein
VLLGTNSSNLTAVLADQELGPSESTTDYKTFTLPSLNPGTTYYWRVVSRTMANLAKNGDLRSFTTAGSAAPPPPTGTPGPGDIILYGADARLTGSQWSIVSDSTAAGGNRLMNPNAGAAKLAAALAAPASYAELTFTPVAGQAYHLWIRGRAQNDSYSNDSVFVQFSNAVTSTGTATYRYGTTSAAEYNLEDCSGCGVSGWGWQDNGYGAGVFGPPIYFDSGSPQTLRIQIREDGLSIDQVMLSPSAFVTTAPGALKLDTTIYPATQGPSATGAPPPPPPPPPALPTGWSHQDIGAVGLAGDATYDSGTSTFTIRGAGADVWGTADALQYAYTTLAGNGSIVARVASTSNTAAWVKAGVMIRGSLDAGSAQAFMLVSYSKGLAFQRRTVNGGTSTSTPGALAPAPYWVKLDRAGDVFTASQSPDGVTWTVVGTDTIPMPGTVYVGLGVSSHTRTATATGVFDHVTVTN